MSYGMASPTGLKPNMNATGGLSGGNKIPKGYNHGQISQYTPGQSQLFEQGLGNVSPDSYTGRLASGDEDIFNEIEAPAFRQFNQLQGQLSSRFSGMGTGGRRSSGFQNSAGQLGSDFAQDLASRRSELQRNAISDLHNMSQQLLGNRPYEQFLTEKPQKQNVWGDIAGKFASAIPGAVGGFLSGGPAGAAAGGLSGFFGGGNKKPSYNFMDEMQSGSGYNY